MTVTIPSVNCQLSTVNPISITFPIRNSSIHGNHSEENRPAIESIVFNEGGIGGVANACLTGVKRTTHTYEECNEARGERK